MFGREGYNWDVGVHAIGGMKSGPTSMLMKNVCGKGKKIEWVSLGDPFDTCFFPGNVEYSMPENIKDLIANLKSIDVKQSQNIDKFFLCVRQASK